MSTPHHPSVTWPQALAWRLRQQLLDPVGTQDVAGVVGRLGAIKADPADAAELAVLIRREHSQPGDVDRALADGTIIKTFAFRGATHYLTPHEGADYLALRAMSRMWELPSWRSYYGLEPSDWPKLREAVRQALANGPLTYDELGGAITTQPKFRRLAGAFRERNFTLLKPLTWQGEMSFGPGRGRATFQRLDSNVYWKGVPDADDAGPRAIEAYFRAYGPATREHLRYWIGSGLGAGGKRIDAWVEQLGDRLTQIEVDGQPALCLADVVEELLATGEGSAVRLLPGYDQWVLGPGTSDTNIVPAAWRSVISAGANILLIRGRVGGTWSASDDRVTVKRFEGAESPSSDALEGEVARLATILDRSLRLEVERATPR